jgi:hypothetical protein
MSELGPVAGLNTEEAQASARSRVSRHLPLAERSAERRMPVSKETVAQ